MKTVTRAIIVVNTFEKLLDFNAKSTKQHYKKIALKFLINEVFVICELKLCKVFQKFKIFKMCTSACYLKLKFCIYEIVYNICLIIENGEIW